MLKTINLVHISKYLYFSLLGLTILFARSFVGIYIFGFRLGELVVVGTFIVSIIFLIYIPKLLKLNNFHKSLFKIQKVIILSFIPISLLTNSNLLDTYAYKSSSYIWTLTILYFGIFFLKDLEKNKLFFYAIFTVLPVLYLISTGFYPNFIMDFFNTYSDKFQFIKGSDLMLSYIVISLTIFKFKGVNDYTVLHLFILSAVYFPLLLFNSRGAFISAFIFFLTQLIHVRKYLFKFKLKSIAILLLSYLFFYGSVLQVYGEFTFIKLGEGAQPDIVSQQVTDIVNQKNTKEAFYGFYIENGRLFSKDNTTNWRLDIWQDVFEDMNDKGIFLTGYGYKEIIPVMLDPSAPGRLGRDGLNENVHNYFVNIFARGGIFQFLLFIAFYIRLIQISKQINGNYEILYLLIPVFLNSSFDANLEGVQYPMIFFSFMGYLYFVKRKQLN